MIEAGVLQARNVTEEISTTGAGREEAVSEAHGEQGKEPGAAKIQSRHHPYATDQVSPGNGANKVPTAKVTWSTSDWKALLTAV